MTTNVKIYKLPLSFPSAKKIQKAWSMEERVAKILIAPPAKNHRWHGEEGESFKREAGGFDIAGRDLRVVVGGCRGSCRRLPSVPNTSTSAQPSNWSTRYESRATAMPTPALCFSTSILRCSSEIRPIILSWASWPVSRSQQLSTSLRRDAWAWDIGSVCGRHTILQVLTPKTIITSLWDVASQKVGWAWR